MDSIQKELIQQLEDIEQDESIDMLTQEGRDMFATRMSQIQAAIELMQRVLLKHGLEGGFVDETTKILAEIQEMQPTEAMSLVPAWFVDARTGNPAVFIFPTNPADAMGEPSVDEVYTPNGLWFAKAPIYHISAILARVFPLPNYKAKEIVPTPVWQVTDCAWLSRLNAQALHLYHFDESVPWGANYKPKTADAEDVVVEDKKKGKSKKDKKTKGKGDALVEEAISTGEAAPPKSLTAVLKEKYTPEKYFEDIKVTVDQFKCNEVFFLLQTLQVRYVAVFSQLVRRIYGEQLQREMTIAAALEEYMDMRKGFTESVTDHWFTKISEKVLIVLLLVVAAVSIVIMILIFGSVGGSPPPT